MRSIPRGTCQNRPPTPYYRGPQIAIRGDLGGPEAIMSDLVKKLAGRFIVLDGPDGSGKSTQLALLREYLTGLGADVETVHDPGGTEVGEKIRTILLDKENGHISPMCELLLFMASRSQLIGERVRPALKSGKVVLCDRFISATVAYQGAAGIDSKTIIELGDLAVGGLWPDLTIILDVPTEVGMQRIGLPRERLKKSGEPSGPLLTLFGDRMETKGSSYHQNVRRIFKELGKSYPRPVAHVNAEKDADKVSGEILSVLERNFLIKNA